MSLGRSINLSEPRVPRNGHARDCGPQELSLQHPGRLTGISRGADLGFSQITAPAPGPQGCPYVSPIGLLSQTFQGCVFLAQDPQAGERRMGSDLLFLEWGNFCNVVVPPFVGCSPPTPRGVGLGCAVTQPFGLCHRCSFFTDKISVLDLTDPVVLQTSK